MYKFTSAKGKEEFGTDINQKPGGSGGLNQFMYSQTRTYSSSLFNVSIS